VQGAEQRAQSEGIFLLVDVPFYSIENSFGKVEG
jgi:hypothetical protein